MKECTSCNELTVNPEDEARYDVLSGDSTGPYCPACWTTTYTYSQILAQNEEDTDV